MRRTKIHWTLALAIMLALASITFGLMSETTQARCPTPLECLGNYSTDTFEGTATGPTLSYYYCEQAKQEAQFLASLDLMTKGDSYCGDFKDACGQRWETDWGCYSEPLPQGGYRFRIGGHYEFGCKRCSPWKPIEDIEDGGR